MADRTKKQLADDFAAAEKKNKGAEKRVAEAEAKAEKLIADAGAKATTAKDCNGYSRSADAEVEKTATDVAGTLRSRSGWWAIGQGRTHDGFGTCS